MLPHQIKRQGYINEVTSLKYTRTYEESSCFSKLSVEVEKKKTKKNIWVVFAVPRFTFCLHSYKNRHHKSIFSERLKVTTLGWRALRSKRNQKNAGNINC